MYTVYTGFFMTSAMTQALSDSVAKLSYYFAISFLHEGTLQSP